MKADCHRRIRFLENRPSPYWRHGGSTPHDCPTHAAGVRFLVTPDWGASGLGGIEERAAIGRRISTRRGNAGDRCSGWVMTSSRPRGQHGFRLAPWAGVLLFGLPLLLRSCIRGFGGGVILVVARYRLRDLFAGKPAVILRVQDFRLCIFRLWHDSILFADCCLHGIGTRVKTPSGCENDFWAATSAGERR